MAIVLGLLMMNANYKEISWKEFFSDFLEKGNVRLTHCH